MLNDTKISPFLTENTVAYPRTNTERLEDDIVDALKTSSAVMNMTKTEKRMEFVALRAQGVSYQNAADILHCSKSTLVAWGKELEDQIAEQQKAEQADILSAYKASREHRIAQFAALYREILAEIEKRSLANIKTEKLFEMLEKCSRCLSELSGESGAQKPKTSVIASTHVECVQTAVECVKTV